jgi:hypothetical protein
MTEDDWLTATDPQEMLRACGTISDRRRRLFAVACVRRVSGLLEEFSVISLEVAERLADGEVGLDELERVENLSWWMADGLNYEEDHVWDAAWAAHAALEGHADNAAALAMRAARCDEEGLAQAALLRDIFGPLPFRPVTLPPSVRTWNYGTIPKLAEAAYQERSMPSGELDRERLAVLADALEEVGADALLLDHLRVPGPHVRGDWVIDLLTGRE